MESTHITKALLDKEVVLHQALHTACRQKEEYLRQKSRSLWLHTRDHNIAYFHKQFEARNHFKDVKEIQAQGQLIFEFDQIKEEAVRRFSLID